MSRQPSLAEIGAFVAHIRAASSTNGDRGPLLADRVEVLERLAAADPKNREVAALARDARSAAGRRARNGR
ncbi:hypothetical protein ACGFX4_40985 [Kitasatospora sp. NPDC048365]|uniref:hypothetical protein n=1 Tax=Kitasatospora sp. NPDC048365 TaxID=3364050 RepID=UPI0037133C66